ncbi:MAG: patatin family protein [Lachnospiraceae bacterium]|nr:patatin family protein [Lachnospiraceae bacterium]
MRGIGVLLEGGAMRNVFTAGIMDFFLEKEIDVKNVLAVSGGAFVGMNYVSGQRGRIMDAVVKPMATERITSGFNLLTGGEFFNMDLLFDEIPKRRSPFDYDAFIKSGKRFITTTIDCYTGEAIYYDKFKDMDDFLHVLRVANSLPLLAKMGHIDGVPMMDGGMADAIPIEYAMNDGWDKVIVILTRDKDYRKSPKGDIYNSRWVKLLYHKYKGLIHAIDERPAKYNARLEQIAELEKEGKIFVYRPEDIELKNHEDDAEVLKGYYRAGHEMAERRYEELKAWLSS